MALKSQQSLMENQLNLNDIGMKSIDLSEISVIIMKHFKTKSQSGFCGFMFL